MGVLFLHLIFQGGLTEGCDGPFIDFSHFFSLLQAEGCTAECKHSSFVGQRVIIIICDCPCNQINQITDCPCKLIKMWMWGYVFVPKYFVYQFMNQCDNRVILLFLLLWISLNQSLIIFLRVVHGAGVFRVPQGAPVAGPVCSLRSAL